MKKSRLGGLRTAGLRLGVLTVALCALFTLSVAAQDTVLMQRTILDQDGNPLVAGANGDLLIPATTTSLSVSLHLTYTGTASQITAFGVVETIPAGFALNLGTPILIEGEDEGEEDLAPLLTGADKPEIYSNNGTTGDLSFGWIKVPKFPVDFAYVIEAGQLTDPVNFGWTHAPYNDTLPIAGKGVYYLSDGQLDGDVNTQTLTSAIVTATRELSGDGVSGEFYVSGQLIDVVWTLDKEGDGTVKAMNVQDTLPDGFTYVGLTPESAVPDVVPAKADGTLVFGWTTPQTQFPMQLVFQVQVPDTATDPVTFGADLGDGAAYADYTLDTATITCPEVPAAALLGPLPFLQFTRTVSGYSPGGECVANCEPPEGEYEGEPPAAEYAPGGAMVQINVSYTTASHPKVNAIGFNETIPAGWTWTHFTGGSSAIPSIPPPTPTGTLEIGWITVPKIPFTFTYYTSIPEDQTGDKQVSGFFTYYLDAGALSTATVVDTISGDQPPVIALTGDNPQVIECGGNYVELGATATDLPDGDITNSIVIDASAVNTAAAGSYEVTYNVTDSTGNTAEEVVRTVNVVDTTPPTLELVGNNPFVHECHTMGLPNLTATATDICAGDISASVVMTGAMDLNTVGTYTLTYNVVDPAGNTATPITRDVQVVDTTAPVITRTGSSPVTVQCGGTYTDAGATVADSCDSAVTVASTGSVNTAVPANYVITYNATDASGNTAAPVTRIVNVVDTTAPVIALAGDNPLQQECSNLMYVDPGVASVTDVCDKALTPADVTTNWTAVHLGTPGSYQVTYTVADVSGNTATASRTVVVADHIAPALTLVGDAAVTVENGSTYTDAGATVFELCDPNVEVTTQIFLAAAKAYVNEIETCTLGVYTLYYEAVDVSGNEAETVERTVTVQDTTAPVITLTGNAAITVECGGNFTDTGATATDVCEGDLTDSIVVGGDTVDTTVVGTYEITYNVTDTHGNAAVEVTRTVTVEDTVKPVIALNGDAAVTLQAGATWTDPGATATDACDGDVAVTVGGDTVDTSVCGEYTITYNAEDTANNAAIEVTRVVTVEHCISYCLLDNFALITPTATSLRQDVSKPWDLNLTSSPNFLLGCTHGKLEVHYTVTVNGEPLTLDPADGISVEEDSQFPVNALGLTATVGVTDTYFITATLYQLDDADEVVATKTVEHTMTVTGIEISQETGMPTDPPGELVGDNEAWNGDFTLPDETCARGVGMLSWIGPDPAAAPFAPVTVVVANPVVGAMQTVTVSVDRDLLAEGVHGVLVVGIACDLSGLLGADQAALLGALNEDLVTGNASIEITILVDNGDGTYSEIEEAALADHPVSITLNGLTFTEGFNAMLMSHETGVSLTPPFNFQGMAGAWGDICGEPEIGENSITQTTCSLSVFEVVEQNPAGPVLGVSPSGRDVVAGIQELGKSVDVTFTVKNLGGAPLSGAATVPSGAFKIQSGGTYANLATGASQTVVVRFTPVAVGNVEAVVTFTGGDNGPLTVKVKGTGTVINTKPYTFFGCSPATGTPGSALADLLMVGLVLSGLVTYRRARQH